MMKCIFNLAFLVLILLNSCEHSESRLMIGPNEELSFCGTYNIKASDSISGTIYLSINNGYYQCSTNQPYGMGAGKLEVQEKTINFIDTLFFPIPAIYGPSFVLSGEYDYIYNDESMLIWRDVEEIKYDLVLINTN